jgi:hypothetical protein
VQCLSVCDPTIAEVVLAELRAIDDGLEVVPYIGGSLKRNRFALIVVASHLSTRGVHLGGDNYLSPMALGNLAETAKAQAVYIASCDGATIALEVAGQAKSATVVYYGAALDADTAHRLATSFAERYYCEGAEAATDAARATGCNVLGAVWKQMTEQTTGGRGFGDNPELMRLLLDMQRDASETKVQVSYLRDDMTAVKADVRRIGEAQAAAGVPLRNIMALLALAVVATAIGWFVVYALSGRTL